MPTFDRNNPATVFLKKRYPLTRKSSSKQTWHITLDTSNVDLDYHPGDSVGIFAQNDPTLVEHLIEALGAQPTDTIIHKRTGKSLTLHTFFTEYANLGRITSSFLKLVHECCPQEKLKKLLDPENKQELRSYLASQDPLGLFREFAQKKLPLQEICDAFGPLLPRFYSVASSKNMSEHELDLTVALFTWMQGEEKRYGVASHFLCHLAEPNKTPIPLFVQPALHFRLPDDHHLDIIMVGPGTGVAPFRAFMQERNYHGSTGKHSLFFGERNRKSDFFYEEEWEKHENLSLHTAFSRDQKEKVYVQHKIWEKREELYQQLNQGALFYVCGDAKEMAKDVEETLRNIFIEKEKLSEAEAKEKLKALRKEGRYLTDVY